MKKLKIILLVFDGLIIVVQGREDSLNKQVVNRRYTNIWVRKEGEWKLNARHSSLVCID